MGAADSHSADAGDSHEADAGAPLTVELLADLQAGLLDDDLAARVRQQVRADPSTREVLLALHQVRCELAAAADPASAPEVPTQVTARISDALRASGGRPAGPDAAHLARPQARPAKVAAAVVGLGAAIGAIAVGTAALTTTSERAPSAPATAQHITRSTPPMTIPLSQAEILGLLNQRPDFGPLADQAHRASCLNGLGYPASTQVLGARPIEINARPGVLLVLPADTPGRLAAFAVATNCNAADTGMLADTEVPRP
ncbi:hypothetical protein [Mycobacterium sp.]|uniref:hypothetical protein n=1 Tax=Mycobacterium sp. TaxID=1785 RepID=UPI0025E5E107|nr:hypothetical protein [Mycobacterium sp.]MBW0013222.1 hypothetical protein [Mycobacterium sp.]